MYNYKINGLGPSYKELKTIPSIFETLYLIGYERTISEILFGPNVPFKVRSFAYKYIYLPKVAK